MKRLLSILALGTAAIAGAASAQTTLVVAIAADPTGLDPEAVLNNTSGFVMATIYDGLVKYKSGTVEPEAGLAESWSISQDGRTYTFKLRKGVKFHDGSTFNAADFVKTINRLKKDDPETIYNTGPVENFNTYADLEAIRAVDDSTVEFKLKNPYGPFIADLAMVWNGVVSNTAYTKLKKDFRTHPVGTGAFIFKEWRQGDQIVLDANPTYWNGKPKVDRLVFKVMPEAQATLLAAKRGDVHIIADVSTQTLPAAKQDSNLVIYSQPGLTLNGIAMSNDAPPWNDKRVRQAMNYAVDKEAITNSLYGGLAVTMNSPLPPAQWPHDASLKAYPYDPEKAKQLLKEAGHPSIKTELLAYSSPRGYNPAGPELAVAVQSYLQKVGVEATIRKQEMGAFLAEVRSGKYQHMFMAGFSGDNGDPDNFLWTLFSAKMMPTNDTSHYNNPEVIQMLTDARQASDPAKRIELYKKAQAVILDDAPWIFVNSTKLTRIARKEVKGFVLNPTQMFLEMEKVSIQK